MPPRHRSRLAGLRGHHVDAAYPDRPDCGVHSLVPRSVTALTPARRGAHRLDRRQTRGGEVAARRARRRRRCEVAAAGILIGLPRGERAQRAADACRRSRPLGLSRSCGRVSHAGKIEDRGGRGYAPEGLLSGLGFSRPVDAITRRHAGPSRRARMPATEARAGLRRREVGALARVLGGRSRRVRARDRAGIKRSRLTSQKSTTLFATQAERLAAGCLARGGG